MPLTNIALDRICIVMLGAAGDVVHTLPVVTAIKRHSPRSRISWILQPGPASLVKGHPGIDDIILFDRKAGFRGFADLRRELSTRRFDITLAMQSYFKSGLITAMTPSPVKLGFDRRRARDFTWIFNTHSLPPRAERHFQDQYLEFVDELGIPAEPLEWNLGPWPHEVQWRDEFAARFTTPIASVVIGASRPEREWIPERWVEVCKQLHTIHGITPVLVGGRSERELRTEQLIMRDSGVPVVSTLGEPFRNLVSILDVSRLVITLDTGPMHMAVAMNRPTISLFGFSNPKRVGPYRRFHHLIVDEYGDQGEDYPVTPRHRSGRMERISVEQVMERVRMEMSGGG
jgi:heptosyltransferase I